MSHFDPTQDTPIKVELQINGVWTDVTARGRAVRDVRIKHAQSDGAIQPETSTCELVLGNDDGWLNEDDLRSPWYPHIGRGTPMRVSLAGLGESDTDAPRFTGEIDEMEAVYQGGDNAVMSVLANGTWGVLAQGADPPQSALYRSMLSRASDDVIPAEYWPLDDGLNATQFSSAVGGGPGFGHIETGGSEAPEPGSHAGIPGSEPVVLMHAGSSINLPVRDYADTGQWVIQSTVVMNAVEADMFVIVKLSSGVTIEANIQESFSGGLELSVLAFNSSGTPVVDDFAALSGGSMVGQPISLVIAGVDTGGGETFTARAIDGSGAVRAEITDSAFGYGTVISPIVVLNDWNPSEISTGIGHLGLFTDPTFTLDTHDVSRAKAASGHDRELVHTRVARAAREVGVSVTVHGVSGVAMGPQRTGAVTDTLGDCAEADGGLFADDVSAIGLTYRCLSHLYSQSPRVHVERGALTPQTRARWDNQRIGNDWTVSRSGGSSAHDSDEAHVAKHRRRFPRSATLHVATDDVLIHHASWRVHLGTVEGPRYPSLGIDMRNPDGAKLDDQILAMIPGDRLTAAAVALPSQHPPGGLDQMVIGWSELLDADEWKIYPVCVPYEPFVVAVLDSDTSGKLDSASSSLMSGVTSSATSLTVTTSLETDLWTTDPGETPIPLTVGGEDMTATAIASALLDTFTRTVGAGSWGTSDSGHTWTLSSAASCSVNGTQGVINLAVTNVERHATTDIGASGMVSMTAQQALGVTPTGAAINWGILLRSTDASNYYWADVQVGTDSSLTLRLIKRVAGAATQMATVTAPITHSTSVPRVLRAQYDPDTGVFRSRIWSSAAAEPPVWHLSTTDTAVPASTHAGVISRLVTGNTNGSTNFLWDRLEADNPQLFTVTRSVNGVVEAHSAGAEVHVKNPIRLAL